LGYFPLNFKKQQERHGIKTTTKVKPTNGRNDNGDESSSYTLAEGKPTTTTITTTIIKDDVDDHRNKDDASSLTGDDSKNVSRDNDIKYVEEYVEEYEGNSINDNNRSYVIERIEEDGVVKILKIVKK